MSEEIRLDPRNARKHPDQNKALIRQSLEEIGPFRSIAVDGDGIVRAGNGVFEQALELGLKVRVIEAAPDELIAVKRLDLVGEMAERAAILDNRAGETSTWDADVLLWLKENQPETVEGLWDTKEWNAVLRQLNDEKPEGAEDPGAQVDEAKALQQKWGTQLGQLWEIPSNATPGKAHRLLCGDSTSLDDVTRLMAGQKAALFATDPPYLVNYDGTNHPHKWGEPDKNKDWSDDYHDWDNAEQGEALYDGFIAAAVAIAIQPDAAWYCWHASRNQSMLERMWEKHGAFVHQQIIWVKDREVLTRSWYLWQHEPCFFGWVRGKKPKRATDEFDSTIWQFPTIAPGVSTLHPTQKPIDVFTIPMMQHTYPGDLCYEPFSGSGSQIVAAETLGRLCFANELMPQFVAVALQRLADMGLEPKPVA